MSEAQNHQPENATLTEAYRPIAEELGTFFDSIVEMPAESEDEAPSLSIPDISSVEACQYAYGVTLESIARFEDSEDYQPPKGLLVEADDLELSGNHYFRQLNRLEQVAGLLGDYLAVYREGFADSEDPDSIALELGTAQGIKDEKRAETMQTRLYKNLGTSLADSNAYPTQEQATTEAERIYEIVAKTQEETAQNVVLLHDAVVQDSQKTVTYADFEAEVASADAPRAVAGSKLSKPESVSNLEQEYERTNGKSIGDNTKAVRTLKEMEAKISELDEKGKAEVSAMRNTAQFERSKDTSNVFSRILRKTLAKLRPSQANAVEQSIELPVVDTEPKTPIRRALGSMAVQLFKRRSKKEVPVSYAQPESVSLELDLDQADKEDTELVK